MRLWRLCLLMMCLNLNTIFADCLELMLKPLIITTFFTVVNGDEYFRQIVDIVKSLSSVNINAESKTICGAQCVTMQCLTFEYEHGVCTLNGVGLAAATLSQTFRNSARYLIVGPGLTTSASSMYSGGYNPGMAVTDDNFFWSPVATDATPWWRLDLGQECLVMALSVFPAQNTPGLSRMTNVKVYVGDSSAVDSDLATWQLMESFDGPMTEFGVRLNFQSEVGLGGDKVRLQKFGGGFDSKMEITNVKAILKC